jgi:hypothetical protein
VRSNLAAAGHAEIAQVALAPLEPHPLARDDLQWYAQRALRSLPRRIDPLLIDGRPAFEPEIELSRYPALPALAERLVAERLVPDATVVLDDINRRGELRILDLGARPRLSASRSGRPSGSRSGASADARSTPTRRSPAPGGARRGGRPRSPWPLGTARNANRVPERCALAGRRRRPDRCGARRVSEDRRARLDEQSGP